MKCQTLFSGTNQKKNISKCRLLFFSLIVQLACVIIFSVNILSVAEVKGKIISVSLRQLDCNPDKLSVSSNQGPVVQS